MFKVEELIAMLDREYEDPAQAPTDQSKHRDRVGEAGDEPAEKMGSGKPTYLSNISNNLDALPSYAQRRTAMYKEYRQEWLSILLDRCLRFKDPCLINVGEFHEGGPYQYPPASYEERNQYNYKGT